MEQIKVNSQNSGFGEDDGSLNIKYVVSENQAYLTQQQINMLEKLIELDQEKVKSTEKTEEKVDLSNEEMTFAS